MKIFWAICGAITTLGIAGLIWSHTSFGGYIQPRFYDSPDLKNSFVEYIDRAYWYTDRKVGIAGYKTIDRLVRLEKLIFNHPLGKINMVRIQETKQIVGYGIKHMYVDSDGQSKWAEFSLEDSDCDGVMDKVFEYQTPVFPPDCFFYEKL